MAASDGASSINVTVRVRPFTIREAAQLAKAEDGHLFLGDGSLAGVPSRTAGKGLRPVIKVVDEKCLVFDPPEDNPVHRFTRSFVPQGKRVKDQTFAFDRVFDENTTQQDVYEATTKNLLDSVLDGYNATVFAYGATGCGKTHTITGIKTDPGIIFLTMQELFEKVQELQEEKFVEVSLSYLEIYNETIRDLLVPGGSKQGLMLREDAHQAVSVAGLSSHRPQNVEEVMEMIVRGNEYRTMSPTEANATSSRSHAVLQINLSSKDRNADVNEPHTMATLSIIDLAGSERASATKNRGERLIEGANINKSLLALGGCINALCDPRKRNHVPYRNSKLTRLLKFSLGGNCKTVMIVCVSPSSAHFDETQNTLRYANRAKNIQTKVTKNVFNVNRHVKDYLKKIDEQRLLIEELRAKEKDFESSAFVKFKKLSEKREIIAKEAISRVRAAYDFASAERQEHVSMRKKLRQLERRISLISSWIAAFDTVCDNREDEEPPAGLTAMRKKALGIQMELEGSRQHYHQLLAKNNWERALDTALQTGVRQLQDADGTEDGSDISNLTREVELLKSNAEREAATAVLEQERGGDAAVLQVQLQAQFETIAILSQIMMMDPEDAIQAAKENLEKLISSCSSATSQVIKPEGGLPVTDIFPPRRQGTPKRKKPVNLVGPSPVHFIAKPSFTETVQPISSPMKGSPRRRKLNSGKKGVQFTPKKKSPSKVKRAVRWRDDMEDGSLADFQLTPKAYGSSSATSSIEKPIPAPPVLQMESATSDNDSSPIPAPPETSVELKPRSSRFQTGFLSKKSETSPPVTAPALTAFSSDSEHSPLGEIQLNKVPFRSPLHAVENASTDVTPNESSGSSSDEERSWMADPNNTQKIRSAIKRQSMTGPALKQRRRSPPGASSGSPPNENALFTAGQARRMVKSERESVSNVLSPRPGAIVKGPIRRTTVGEDKSREGSALRTGPMRHSSITASSTPRGSLSSVKGAWR
ncbi:kinesin family protein-like protein [Pseudovirgaria hyperparasitica]|uniref:Kinesin-like protein n=1 Tax=Pseudovirgaria hyperparasitica TaxID=470096 RepID=A0A6A6W093_9PEZI|nr:kinesin family protein-like protein [Pseudovirgaria hyperparasitica]KAF2754997.1 kinesin family protein-like protein [Pseudovirgaria hyperparasitica]